MHILWLQWLESICKAYNFALELIESFTKLKPDIENHHWSSESAFYKFSVETNFVWYNLGYKLIYLV